jgi:hypothetical protein
MTQKYFRHSFPCVSLNTDHTEPAQGNHLQESWVGGRLGLDTSLAKREKSDPVNNIVPPA